MNNFNIEFTFDSRHYTAEVSVIEGKDHTQYNISPLDDKLFVQYGTQVIHVFPGESADVAFPGRTDEKQEYSRALATALRHFLETKKK
jgi:hypothetical protein